MTFIFTLLYPSLKNYNGDEIKENELEEHVTNREGKKFLTASRRENLTEIDHLEDPGMDGNLTSI